MFPQPYIYVETAFHHEGDFNYLKSLIETAGETGAQGIKFQVLINLNEFLSTKHTAYGVISQWIFTKEQWIEACKIAKSNNLDIIWMPLDVAAVNLAEQLKEYIQYLELHSVSFYDQTLNQAIKFSGIPLIIGTGGRTVEEIGGKVKYYHLQFQILMTGFQAFPTNLHDVKLCRIKEYQAQFPNLKIGYADHSDYKDELAILSNEYAYLLGASVLEKHLTLEEGKKRTDYEAAVGKEKMHLIVKRINRLHSLLTLNQSENEVWQMEESEVVYRNRQKVWVANKNLILGTKITDDDIQLKMINVSGGITDRTLLIDQVIKKEIEHDAIITQKDFQ